MKVCPVCKATCFDDMDACYECLHRFADSEASGDGANLAGEPVLTAEYIEAPPSSEGASEMAGCLVLRIDIPRNKGSFTVRCDNLRIEGSLA